MDLARYLSSLAALLPVVLYMLASIIFSSSVVAVEKPTAVTVRLCRLTLRCSSTAGLAPGQWRCSQGSFCSHPDVQSVWREI